MRMKKQKFLELMRFPNEWKLWDMYPDELALIQMSEYKKGHEESPEHTRFGAFLWWIARLKNQSQYDVLIKLSYLEPDTGMAAHVRQKLKEQTNIKAQIEPDYIQGDRI